VLLNYGDAAHGRLDLIYNSPFHTSITSRPVSPQLDRPAGLQSRWCLASQLQLVPDSLKVFEFLCSHASFELTQQPDGNPPYLLLPF
jgi:hypothetical protein